MKFRQNLEKGARVFANPRFLPSNRCVLTFMTLDIGTYPGPWSATNGVLTNELDCIAVAHIPMHCASDLETAVVL